VPDDAATALRQALEEASRLRRENAQLAQQSRESRTQLHGEAGARIAAQDTAIDGLISAAEQQNAAAQAEHERLLTEGDFKGATAATARMVEASTRIAHLRSQKDQVALQRANYERATTQQDTSPPADQQPDPMAGMNERERQWVAEHPAYLNDPTFRNRAAGAAGYAINTLGMNRDSQEYIDFVNRSLAGQGPAPMSIPADNGEGTDPANSDVTVPRMPAPEVPRPISADPNDPEMRSATEMVDQMYPQQRAIGNGGDGIRSIAAPPTRTIRELSRQHQRGRAIEPTLEEYDTALRLIPDILGAEGLAMSDEDKIRTYHAWYNAPSSQRKLRRWYGRDAA
jgi:hypothetical protein